MPVDSCVLGKDTCWDYLYFEWLHYSIVTSGSLTRWPRRFPASQSP